MRNTISLFSETDHTVHAFNIIITGSPPAYKYYFRLLFICQSNLRSKPTSPRDGKIIEHPSRFKQAQRHLLTIIIYDRSSTFLRAVTQRRAVCLCLVHRSLRRCGSLTQLIGSSLLSADLNDFPIKAGLMYRSICTQSLSRIDRSQMSLPRPGPGAVIQKSSALSGPNVMRPGCAHANKTKCQHRLSAHNSQLCCARRLNCGCLRMMFACSLVFQPIFYSALFLMFHNAIHSYSSTN